MSFKNAVCIALGACATAVACSAATDPGLAINGTYVLESATGRGPATGTLILTRQGYAERRVRFREADGGLSREYLARGTVELKSDGTIDLWLRDIDPASENPWTPDARLIKGGVELAHDDMLDGSEILETYRKQ